MGPLHLNNQENNSTFTRKKSDLSRKLGDELSKICNHM